MLAFLKNRSEEEEIMDDFTCNGQVVDQTLKELHLINSYLGGNDISIHGIQKLIKKKQKNKYSIIDLGCGGGDTLKLFSKWTKRKKLTLDLTGVDANEYIITYAKENTSDSSNISYLNEDIFSNTFKNRTFDIAHGSLFFHHFDKDNIVDLLHQLYQQVTIGIVINDLHRHPISYYFTKWILTLWSSSEMVKYDSVLSVARSFTRSELESYLHQAGIKNYTLKWRWAFRWELIIYH